MLPLNTITIPQEHGILYPGLLADRNSASPPKNTSKLLCSNE